MDLFYILLASALLSGPAVLAALIVFVYFIFLKKE